MKFHKKRKRATTWKVLRRCVIFFTAICVIPVLLVLLVTTDQYMRPVRTNRIAFVRPEGDGFSHIQLGKNMSAVAERMMKRKMYLKKKCNNLGLDILGNDTLHKPNPWEFLVNKKHRLIWCNVFKAGSTSWMYNFNLLAGYSPQFLKKTKQVPLNLARQRYPRPSVEELQNAFRNSVSFLIVRHPLERLLSGYKDKIQYSLPHTYHRKLGNEIIFKYRKHFLDEKLKTQRYPSFPEFVNYLLDSVQDEQPMDMHWTPVTDFCTPCMFNFDVIAHTETLQEDQEYIIKKSHLQDIIKPEWKNAGHGMSTKSIEDEYSQLTRAQILQLYHLYKYDFELFNYSLQGYLEIGKPDKDPSDLLKAITMKEKPKKNKQAARYQKT